MNLDELRKDLLTQIQSARREYFRLKAEIEALNPQLPQGCYISNYTSNYNWKYHSLGNKDAVLPCATDASKTTKKRHLGLNHNPNYRLALLEIEQTRLWQVKTDTLKGITNHLNELKLRWLYLRKLRTATTSLDLKTAEGKLLTDFAGAVQNESIFGFILRQYSSVSNLD